MKSGAVVFFTAFLALAASWGGFVLAPQVQLGRNAQTNAIGSGVLYPQARPGLAKQGAEVYRSLGCVYCHTRQVGQEGARREMVLASPGTNETAAIAALQQVDVTLDAEAAREILRRVPTTILTNATRTAADAVVKAFEPTGAKVETDIVAVGPDIARNWGKRRSVARDYLFDHPVQLGTRRIGPDLANVGNWRPDANWHLQHLYAPQSNVKGSAMPPYRFLFETRRIGSVPASNALKLPSDFAPPAGYEVVPTEKALTLVAYLLSLNSDVPLFESPVTPPPAPPEQGTNAAPPAVTNAATQMFEGPLSIGVRQVNHRKADELTQVKSL
jgi:cbb3-type cytochrome oxidase cytochrome c subunit